MHYVTVSQLLYSFGLRFCSLVQTSLNVIFRIHNLPRWTSNFLIDLIVFGIPGYRDGGRVGDYIQIVICLSEHRLIDHFRQTKGL